jgi:hypothetical protein
MSEIENNEAVEFAPEEVVDPIEAIYQGECLSLSGRSTLTYAIGRHTEDGTLHLAITGNTGGGMWCKEWISASAIQDVVLGESGLKARSFRKLQEGRSINGSGFVQAAVRDLGLIRTNEENTRLHEHIPTTTFEQVVMARIAEASGQVVKPPRRKAKEG